MLLPARDYTVLEQDRFELDLIPLSAFVDVTPANGFHLRIGTQPVSMARMDFYSPNDILAVYDLRGQAKLAAGGGRLSQPAVRMDWDMGSWATLQVIYLPWFMPNLSRPNRDLYVARVLGTGGNGIRPADRRPDRPQLRDQGLGVERAFRRARTGLRDAASRRRA